MRLSFHGGAGTVTGSRFELEAEGSKLLVDCGLFQGIKALRMRNREEPGFRIRELDGIALTHGHIDHSGYLPLVVKRGFRGPIFCTKGTADLLQILLPDAAYLQEEDARHANRYGYSRHAPAKPLYTREDVDKTLPLLEPVDFDQLVSVGSIELKFTPVGHILGAAAIRARTQRGVVGFTGDVGRSNDLLMNPPRRLEDVDWLVVESTYGDRRHPPSDAAEVLAEVVTGVCGKGGVLLIPAFAVGRSQTLLHLLIEGMEKGTMPKVPIYLDSPMAVSATQVFLDHVGEHRLTPEQCQAMADRVTYVGEAEASKRLSASQGPMVIVSASGMCTGGRVLHHLKAFIQDRRNGVLIVGYQAAGTRGQALLSQVEEIKIHGMYWPVEAQIFSISSLSAHADHAELVDWLRPLKPPAKTFVVHGEPAASDAFRRYLADRLGWPSVVPELGSTYEL